MQKRGYREILEFLVMTRQYPMLLTKTQAQEILSVSYPSLTDLIRKRRIIIKDGRIPIGSVVNYLCE